MDAPPAPRSQDARTIAESRETLQAMQFFMQAIAKGMGELDTRLGRVEVATSTAEYEEKLARVEIERDQAQSHVLALDEQLRDAQRELAELQQELVRQHVTFADHHAAKQEIMRLRGELDWLKQGMPAQSVSQEPAQQRKWRLLGKS